MKTIISFSGGKDSTATIILAKIHGLPMDEIITVAPDPFKKHTEFIQRVEEFAEMPIKVLDGPSFEDYFFTKKTNRSKWPGTIQGWPMTIGKRCARVMKWDVQKEYFKKVGGHQSVVGIAADEIFRLEGLYKTGGVSYLDDCGYDQDMALELCKEFGLLNPLYEHFSRLGCVRCPKQSLIALRKVCKLEPEKWQWCKANDHLSPVSFRADGRTFSQIAKMIEAQKSFWMCGPNYSINADQG